MSDMKCPFCQQKLDTGNYYVHCHNPHCNTTVDMEGTEELWQALIIESTEHDLTHDALVKRTQELDRTQKALRIAVDALNGVCKDLPWIKRVLDKINEITKGGKDA